MSEPRSTVTKNSDLSLWKLFGLTVPPDLINFQEQLIGVGAAQYVVTFFRWRVPKKDIEVKAEGELP